MSNKQRTDEEIAVNKTVGQNIKYLRKLHNLNQSKVGAACGVTFQQIQKYEKGLNGLSALRLKQLSEKFKVSLDVLLNPNMISLHRGFTENKKVENQLTPQDAGYLKPQKGIGSMEEITKDQMDAALDKAKAEGYLEPKVMVGSLEEIKNQLKKDGIDPEESILPTLRKAANEYN
jgi:transcriptional regulator with XRE-family HTH domain